MSVDILDESGWRELFSSLEYLDKSHKNDFEAFSLSPATDGKIEVYLERALAYFIYRHCTEAEDVDDFVSSLGLCLVLERLLAFCVQRGSFRKVFQIALRQEYSHLLMQLIPKFRLFLLLYTYLEL